MAVLSAPAASYVTALTAPGSADWQTTSVEWVRDHGGGPLVDTVENWWYAHNRPTGAAPAAGTLPTDDGPAGPPAAGGTATGDGPTSDGPTSDGKEHGGADQFVDVSPAARRRTLFEPAREFRIVDERLVERRSEVTRRGRIDLQTGAVFGKALRQREPDTLRRAGDERPLACQSNSSNAIWRPRAGLGGKAHRPSDFLMPFSPRRRNGSEWT